MQVVFRRPFERPCLQRGVSRGIHDEFQHLFGKMPEVAWLCREEELAPQVVHQPDLRRAYDHSARHRFVDDNRL